MHLLDNQEAERVGCSALLVFDRCVMKQIILGRLTDTDKLSSGNASGCLPQNLFCAATSSSCDAVRKYLQSILKLRLTGSIDYVGCCARFEDPTILMETYPEAFCALEAAGPTQFQFKTFSDRLCIGMLRKFEVQSRGRHCRNGSFRLCKGSH